MIPFNFMRIKIDNLYVPNKYLALMELLTAIYSILTFANIFLFLNFILQHVDMEKLVFVRLFED